MGPLGGDLGYLVTFLCHHSSVATAQPALKFCAQPQATPCAPLCLYCHLYLENDSTLLCHRDVTNPLKTDMDLFIGAIGLLQVPERGLQRNSVLCGHSATAVTYSDSRTKNDLMPSSLSESKNTAKPFFCTNIRALWKRESRESQK